jgi:nitronate monooxygenase
MGWNHNEITRNLGIHYPIFQAGMAGGITTVDLVAEASNNGILGNLGAGYMPPVIVDQEIKKITKVTNNPFGVNLFVPSDFTYSEEAVRKMQMILARKYQVHEQVTIKDYKSIFEDQVEIILQNKVSVCSFTFGIPESAVISELKKNGTVVIGTATTVNEAVQLEGAGVDMVVAQGSEAGGHRGTFPTTTSDALIGTMSLIPQIVDNISVPVIAAGGIMDGRGIVAAFALGAQGVQLGTAFLTCRESGAHPLYKASILEKNEDDTTLTTTFTGKQARGIKNKYMEEMLPHQNELLPYPVQHELTTSLRKKAAQDNNPEQMSMWAGQGIRLAKGDISVKELVELLIEQTNQSLDQLRIQ